MPRAAGQIDPRKSEAILDAASALFAEKGVSASMDQIAKRAGVSKQTLYNRFPSRVEIAAALAGRRSDAITAPLRSDGAVLTVLTAVASSLIERLCSTDKAASLRGVVLMSPEAPDLSHAVYDAGPGESLRRLAVWLRTQDTLGRLDIPDPDTAAEVFIGMATGLGHLRAVLDAPHSSLWRDPARPAEIARRFIRAYSADG